GCDPARALARPRRDDGGDHGDRQPARGRAVAVRARLHDGERHRQRVHRGDVRPLSVRAHRGRAAALRRDRDRQRAGAAARVVRRRPREGRPRMTPAARRAVNVVMSWLAASAAGLVVLPLLLIFAFLLWQGASAVNLDFFVRLPKPVGETGGGALAVIMLPIVVRTSEEMVRLVPASLREAALALGIPEWKMLLRVVLPTARAGIIIGAMVAIARVAGETAPLLFTAFGNRFWHQGLDQPIAAL